MRAYERGGKAGPSILDWEFDRLAGGGRPLAEVREKYGIETEGAIVTSDDYPWCGLMGPVAQRDSPDIVAPGQIETDRPKSAGPRPPMDTPPPINRLGHVEEIAGMIHYLCLPEADYITGQTMHVNGGVYYGV